METTKLKRFATEARAKLRAGVATKIKSLGFDAVGNAVPGSKPTRMVGGCTWNGQILPSVFAEQWEALRHRLKAKGLKEVVEEGAYTWFNRLMAIRILSMNGIAEPVLRFVDEARTPKIVDDARQGRVIPMPDQQLQRLRKLFEDSTRINEQFALLVTEFCHQTPILQACFGSLADYTELLLPNNILEKGGFIEMLNTADFITDEDYKSAELIGWLYQFYISDRKDEVFAKKGKVEADEIPAATQIFTPNWIVKYMVQNAVLPQVRSNRLPEEDKKYLINDELPEEPKKPKDLKVADLACGSGHILNECFDLLFDLYIASGYGRADAIESIFANNLVGIDIDERARQLATFALMLKACQRDDSFADARALPRVYSVPSWSASNKEEVTSKAEEFFRLSDISGEALKELREAFGLMKDADSLGSIMKFNISSSTRVLLQQTFEYWTKQADNPEAVVSALPAVRLILALTDSYDAIVMNPPYMGSGKMDIILTKYVRDVYPDSKADLMTVFMEVAIRLSIKGGYWSMINLPSWMFLGSFEMLRKKLISSQQIIGLNHNGRGVFGSDFGSVSFVCQNSLPYKKGIYYRLFTEHVQVRSNEQIHQLFLNKNVVFEADQRKFAQIPGWPISYWVNETFFKPIEECPNLGEISQPRAGLQTSDNNRFLRNWHEVSYAKIGLNLAREEALKSDFKWFPHNKGGAAREWYGNRDLVINFANDGEELKYWLEHNPNDPTTTSWSRNLRNYPLYFHEALTWSAVGSGRLTVRFSPTGSLFDTSGPILVAESQDLLMYILGLTNTVVFDKYLSIFAQGISKGSGHFSNVPFKYDVYSASQIKEFVRECISISKQDWDAHETSWDFKENEFIALTKDGLGTFNSWVGTPENVVRKYSRLDLLMEEYEVKWEELFYKLHSNEEELNRQFIEIYGLQSELNPDVPLEEITILQQGEIKIKSAEDGYVLDIQNGPSIPVSMPKRLEWQRDAIIKQLISYMVGVWMGRYRLDRPGLNIAHPDPTEEELASYQYGPDNATLVIDDDAIIPILPTGAPFDDNLSQYISDFVRIAWGEASQTDNLNFIEKCLGKKIEDYVQKDFWKDHKKMYQNRPIYWLFSSKKGAFKALVYVHRMHPYTVEQVRTRYLLKYLDWLRSEAQRLEIRDADLTTAERRRLDRLRTDIEECEEYHERLQVIAEQAIPIDLDNGIPANHALFGDILTKLK